MNSDSVPNRRPQKTSLLADFLSVVVAVPLALLALLMALYMVLANMNIHFGSLPQVGVFLAGWTFVGSAFFATYRLLRHPTYWSFWFLIPPALCFAMVLWLIGFPENRSLLH